MGHTSLLYTPVMPHFIHAAVLIASVTLTTSCFERRVAAAHPKVRCASCDTDQRVLGHTFRVHARWTGTCEYTYGSINEPDTSPVPGDCDHKPFAVNVVCSTPCDVREEQGSSRSRRPTSPRTLEVEPEEIGPFSFQVVLVRTDTGEQRVYDYGPIELTGPPGPEDIALECFAFERRRQGFGDHKQALDGPPRLEEFTPCSSTALSHEMPLFLVYSVDEQEQQRSERIEHGVSIGGVPLRATHSVTEAGRPHAAYAYSLADAFPERVEDGELAPGEYQLEITLSGSSYLRTVTVE